MESIIHSTSMPLATSHDMDDASLLARYRHGDATALHLLLERHGPVVRAVCRRRLNNHALADDAAQAVFMVLATKATTLNEPRALAAWLHRTALNASEHVERSEERRRARERIAGEALAREAVMSADSPASDERWDAIRPHLDAAVSGLRPAQRDVVIGYYLQGKPQAEVASELGCSEAAVKMRLQSALEKLRSVLAQRGVTISAMTLATLMLSSARAQAVEPGFTTACLTAVKGGASPTVNAITQGLLHGGSAAKLLIATAAALALIAGAGVVLVFTNAQTPVSPTITKLPTTKEAPMNPLVSMTALALAASATVYAEDNAGNVPAPRANPSVGLSTPGANTPPPGGVALGSNNGANPSTATPWQPSPAQQAQMQQQQRAMLMANAAAQVVQGKEVELVVLTISSDGGDKAALAHWAELAGEGYEIAQVVDQGNHCYLFLQRNHVAHRTIQLPATVEQDKALADTIRETLKAYYAAQGQVTPDPINRAAGAPAQTTARPAGAGF